MKECICTFILMIKNFPKIPACKVPFNSKHPSEYLVIQKILNGQNINAEDEMILNESLGFYKELFPFLKAIDLSELTDEDAALLKEYTINSVQLIVTPNLPDISFDLLHRVTTVKDSFLENNKVRSLKYVIHPSTEVVKQNGIFGRANSLETTVFYCSMLRNVAIIETSPKVNDRIILTEWAKNDSNPFITCPVISRSESVNDNSRKIKTAYEDLISKLHPLFAEILNAYFDFFSSEILKKVESRSSKRYEYFFSALFSDLALEQTLKWKKSAKKIDCMIYPSVALNHKEENLAILPDSVRRLRPVKMIEGIVTKTLYENVVEGESKLPIEFHELRTATKFEGNTIVWSDD